MVGESNISNPHWNTKVSMGEISFKYILEFCLLRGFCHLATRLWSSRSWRIEAALERSQTAWDFHPTRSSWELTSLPSFHKERSSSIFLVAPNMGANMCIVNSLGLKKMGRGRELYSCSSSLWQRRIWSLHCCFLCLDRRLLFSTEAPIKINQMPPELHPGQENHHHLTCAPGQLGIQSMGSWTLQKDLGGLVFFLPLHEVAAMWNILGPACPIVKLGIFPIIKLDDPFRGELHASLPNKAD